MLAGAPTGEKSLFDYHEAVDALNRLQSNAAALKDAVARKLQHTEDPAALRSRTVDLTLKYLTRCGIDVGDLERRVIHVAGTKGKGSTCAYCESVLRRKGYRTGLFTSPHLVTVAERIRIGGRPLTRHRFARHFWRVYNALNNNKEHESDMPTYFKFLTVMAFSVFLHENVDVAIIEVGIGGQNDCTNVFKFKPVVGISSLGFDHTRLLGSTIESIAWQKGGIMTPGCRAFTCPGQPPSALRVLEERAAENKCTLSVAPGYGEYRWPPLNNRLEVRDDGSVPPAAGEAADVQFLNRSLAIQLTNAWIGYTERKSEEGGVDVVLDVDAATVEGIAGCVWPGRYQHVAVDGIDYFIDGAHTGESMVLCARWFARHSPPDGNRGRDRVLVFNCTGGRQAASLLAPLIRLNFNRVYFTTNQLYDEGDARNTPDTMYVAGSKRSEAVDKCREHADTWRSLMEESRPTAELRLFANVNSVVEAVRRSQQQQQQPQQQQPQQQQGEGGGSATCGCDVLVTGSLHLVGAVLALIQTPPY